MFDIGAFELLLIVAVAVMVIGPKEMPRALRTAGQWMGKARRISTQFRTGIDAMIREAELEDAEKEWKQRNADIMAKSAKQSDAGRPDKAADPADIAADKEMQATQMPPPKPVSPGGEGDTKTPSPDAAAEAAIKRAAPEKAPEHGGEAAPGPQQSTSEPQLPLADPPVPPKKSGKD
ncbi:Sec-independent protein translocase protein TatB [Qipengyuania sp. DGS5-3]|uniref:Sec-independent protein translocase protein TatB n=1 Tax=Qipengyuania sp. DGS5-3 TaxID=3349632 RepID=UPI0036D42E79